MKRTPEELAEDEERTTAQGLARYAFEYINAALLVDEHHGARPEQGFASPIPAYFLALHGIELTLKAFLRFHGVSVQKLGTHEYGHDIRACYRKAKEFGLRDVYAMKADDLRAMLLLIALNERNALRYIRTGLYRYPAWSVVEPLAVGMHKAVASVVGARTFTRVYGAA
jgi:hypothetical protein